MDPESLKALQAPIKDHYRSNLEAALTTLHAESNGVDGIACKVSTRRSSVEAGLHPPAGVGTLGVAKDALVGFRELIA